MKKLISLLLVVMMLCSISTVAFADDREPLVGDHSARFAVTKDTAGNDVSASQKTDVYLQVEASGQIDVTVPLVLVFQTNIDGGTASTGTNYGITNNSTAPLAVTSIVVAVDETGAAGDVMVIVNYPASGTPEKDKFAAKISANGYSKDLNAIYTATNSKDSKNSVDGGLFQLPLDDATTNTVNESFTAVDMSMTTGKLSFVTGHSNDTTLNPTKGLKLLTMTYTVAIDAHNVKGGDIGGSEIVGHSHNATGDLVEHKSSYSGVTTTPKD